MVYPFRGCREWPTRLSKDKLSDVHRLYGWLRLWNRVAGEIALFANLRSREYGISTSAERTAPLSVKRRNAFRFFSYRLRRCIHRDMVSPRDGAQCSNASRAAPYPKRVTTKIVPSLREGKGSRDAVGVPVTSSAAAAANWGGVTLNPLPSQVLIGCYFRRQTKDESNKQRQREASKAFSVYQEESGNCLTFSRVQQTPLPQSVPRHH
jgi:hypothetical protein